MVDGEVIYGATVVKWNEGVEYPDKRQKTHIPPPRDDRSVEELNGFASTWEGDEQKSTSTHTLTTVTHALTPHINQTAQSRAHLIAGLPVFVAASKDALRKKITLKNTPTKRNKSDATMDEHTYDIHT